MYLHIQDIQKSFGDKHVLDGASYRFQEGKITGLLGRNGAGKTTLFSILYGEYGADGGQIELIESDGQARPLEVEDIGMVFSENYLPEFMTGYEFLQFYISLHGRADSQSVEDYLAFMDISLKDGHRLIKGYSDGMKSKLSLLCIFIARPQVILLDEPLTAVDVVSSIAIKKMLLQLREDHIILLSTHIMALAEDLCDEVVVLDKGRLTRLDYDKQQEQFEESLLKALKGGE